MKINESAEFWRLLSYVILFLSLSPWIVFVQKMVNPHQLAYAITILASTDFYGDF